MTLLTARVTCYQPMHVTGHLMQAVYDLMSHEYMLLDAGCMTMSHDHVSPDARHHDLM